MTRSHLTIALALVPAATAVAFPLPRPAPDAPLPEGALRRFGQLAPAAPKAQDLTGPRAAKIRRQEPESPTGAAFGQTPDGRHLIVGDGAGRIDEFEFATGRLVRRLQEPNREGIHVLAVSPDGRWLAVSRVLGHLQLWDLAAGKVETTLGVGPRAGGDGLGRVQRLAFGPDSRVLFTGVDSTDATGNPGATAWEVPSGKRLWNATGVGYNLAADPRGRWVLTGLIQAEPPRLGLLDAASGRVAHSMVIDPSWEITEAGAEPQDASWTLDRRFTPDGSRLVSIHGDGTARVWDREAGKELIRMKWGAGRSAEPGGLAISPDGRWLAVRDGRQIQIWETASGRRAHTITGLDGVPRELAFTRDGHGLIVSTGPAPLLWTLRPKAVPTDATDAAWDGLASDDAAAAYRLVWALAANPKAAIATFASRVRPADLVLDRARFDRLVAALDGVRYADRERAEAELTRAGIAAPVGWVRAALAAARSEEVRTRLERVRAARETPSPARWRLARAVQVLEMARTDEATGVLKEWAGGPPGGFLTDEAGAAVARLAARR